MFSSSNINTGDSDCFGEHSYGFMAPSSFQLGSSSSPAFVELDQFFVTNYLAMSTQGLGLEEGNPYDRHPTLIGNGHDLVDGIMVAGSFDGNDNISCNLVMEEEVCRAKKNQTKAIGSSSNDENNKKDFQPVQRPTKRIHTGKKDRHSKISTAQGPRDRRMRLSLQTASKFFDLQDKLGFDKASKTIEWLFNMSKNAIREVMGNSYSRMDEPRVSYVDGTNNICSDNAWKNHLVSPWSEYEEASEDIAINHKTYGYEYCTNNKLHMVNKHCRSMNKKLRRTQYVPNWPQLRKDDRDKARAMARERTVEKMRLKALKDSNQGLVATSRVEQTGACTAFEHVHSSGSRSQSVEELIRAEWEEIEEAKRLYSGYMFHDTTPQHQNVLSSIRYQSW